MKSYKKDGVLLMKTTIEEWQSVDRDIRIRINS